MTPGKLDVQIQEAVLTKQVVYADANFSKNPKRKGKCMKCKYCGSYFERTNNSQKYCSDDCKTKAKKLFDKYHNYMKYRARKRNKPRIIATCQYCGKEFVKTHGNKKYCSATCSANKKLEQGADASLKYYHHTKKLRGGDKVWGLGTGGLGAHMHDDFDVEREKIENEMRRLRLS